MEEYTLDHEQSLGDWTEPVRSLTQLERKSQVDEWLHFHRHCQALNDRCNAPSIFLAPGLSST